MNAAKYKRNSAPNKFDHGVRTIQRVRDIPSHTKPQPRITSLAGTVSETIPAREKAVRRNCTVRLSVRMPSWLMRHGKLSPPHPGRDHLHVPRAHAPRPPAGCARMRMRRNKTNQHNSFSPAPGAVRRHS